MTIQSENRKSGPFHGDGRVSRFPFDFKVFSESDLSVTVRSGDSERSLLHGSDYEVSLQADQEMAPGGEVLLKTPLSDGARLVIVSAIPPLQLAKFTNQGGFYPVVLNDALDRLTILCQQLSEKSDRAIRYGVTSGDLSSELPPPKAGFGIGWSEDGRSLVNTDYHIKAAASAQAAQESYSAAQNAALSAAASADEAKKAVPVIYGNATTTDPGIVRLSSATDSAAEDKAATPKAVKAAYDRAIEAEGKGIPLGAVIGFPSAITNPPGYLKADGSTFDQATYPDLYAALGNSNKLPDLRHDSIGMMAWCPTDTPPEGWLPCDGRTINQDEYPELYAYLGSRYGAAGKLPEAQDRYIRNAGNGLTVGQLQDDEIKRHVHKFISSDVTGSDALAVVRSDLFEQDDDAPDQLQHANIVGDGAWGDNGWAQPKLTSPYATGGDETRPKTIVLKLCIKARSGRGDVSYWVRAYGAVSNPGSLDAAALAGSIQQINSAAQQADQRIGGVEQHINGQLGTLTQQIQALQQGGPQQLAETGYQQLPGGLILQWGRVQLQRNNSRINYPIAFQVACLIVNATTGANTVQIGVHSPDKTGFTIYASSQHGNHTHWLAIGH